MRILIVDDDPLNRLLLSRVLGKWKYEVVQASDGAEAWEILQEEKFSFIISDWIMPGMDGPELCRRIRSAGFSWYVYVILLTAIEEKAALVVGMEAGADDFMVKPFNENELRVRIRAGERVLGLERDLEERNNKLGEAYAAARRDLEAAAAMQKSLLPGVKLTLNGLNFSWMFSPCSFVAGDIFNYFKLDDHRAGFYLLDVAGHGVASAMLSFSLSKILSPSPVPDSLLRRAISSPPYYEVVPPAEVVRELNQRFQDKQDAMQYFTMIYGIVNTEDHRIRITQAGHPCPIHQNEMKIRLIGESGFPVGALPDLEYEEKEFEFHNGDRLFLYSDGVTECSNQLRERFRTERLVEHLREQRGAPLEELVNSLGSKLRRWRGTEEFQDDVTLLAIERS